MALFKVPVTLIQPSAAGNNPTEFVTYGRRISDVSGSRGVFDDTVAASTTQTWEVDLGGTTIAGIGTRWRVRISGEVFAVQAAFKPKPQFLVWRLVLSGSSLTGDLAP